MKTIFEKIAFVICLAALALSGCDSNENTKREKVAEEELKKEELNFTELKKQSREDSIKYAKYKTETEARLSKNDDIIAEIKAKIKSDRKAIKKEYEKAVDDLEKRNETMKTRLRDAEKNIANDWETFKYKFNKDMDELGKSISGAAEKNMKKNKKHTK